MIFSHDNELSKHTHLSRTRELTVLHSLNSDVFAKWPTAHGDSSHSDNVVVIWVERINDIVLTSGEQSKVS